MQTRTEDREKGLMTSGGIYRQILYFSIPLLLGNLFQLMYNTIDSVVVGNYVGSTALAAVGASTPVINLLIAFFMGLAVGAGVVVSRYFGARRIPEMSAAIHTFLAFSLWFGIGMSVFGMLMSSLILHWIGVPADVSIIAWDDSVLCEHTLPKLTALSHDVVAFGAHVARRLFDVIEGTEPAAFLDSTPRLVIRGSTFGRT